MNRELKLALIVGFALVLVVTVLISDHLSKARGTRLASNIAESPALIVPASQPANEPAMLDPGLAAGPVRDPISSGQAEPAGMIAAMDPGLGAAPQPEPVMIHQGRTPGSDPRIASSSGIDDAFRRVIEQAGGKIVDDTVFIGRDPGASPSGAQPPGPRPEDRTTPPPAAVPEPAPGPGASTTHVVAKGDNLFKLAKQHLGDGHRWRRIAEANPGVVDSQGNVKVGVRLTIPAAASASVPAPRAQAAPSAREQAATTRPYEIKKGDTLGLIAQRELGTVKRTGEIIALNRSIIKDADSVPLGVTIRLPAR